MGGKCISARCGVQKHVSKEEKYAHNQILGRFCKEKKKSKGLKRTFETVERKLSPSI